MTIYGGRWWMVDMFFVSLSCPFDFFYDKIKILMTLF